MTPTEIEAAWFALARDFTYTGPHDRYAAHAIVAEHRPRIEAAILANGAVFLPDAAELDRLRADRRLLLAYLERFIDFDNGGATDPQYVTANGIRQDMPKRLRADALALRAALQPEGSAGT